MCLGQSEDNLQLIGDYSKSDSIRIYKSYNIVIEAVNLMRNDIEEIYHVGSHAGEKKKDIRIKNWNNNEAFLKWMGKPDKIGKVHRKIIRIHSKLKKKFILEVSKKNKGRCTGWISAWAIPYGKVHIILCEDFFIYRTHLQEKVIIHELGHEAGMFSHRNIHGCRAAKRAASSRRNTAKKSPENYAWLAMSYMGLECGH